MLKKILMGAGMAYLARRFMGGRRTSAGYSNRGTDLGRHGW
jgi:hypothetical protein